MTALESGRKEKAGVGECLKEAPKLGRSLSVQVRKGKRKDGKRDMQVRMSIKNMSRSYKNRIQVRAQNSLRLMRNKEVNKRRF